MNSINATIVKIRLRGGMDGGSYVADVDSSEIRPRQAVARRCSLSPGIDAGTTVPLQPGLCWLWQDPIPCRHSEKAADSRTVFSSGRGMRSPDGFHSGR